MSEAMVEEYWNALTARDGAYDGVFVFAVTTTKIYCRPSCPARRPLKRNVRFFALAREAEAEGFRACKRCKPNAPSQAQLDALTVETACRALSSEDAPPLDALAAEAGKSAHHFHRLFKAHTGLTPKGFGAAVKARRMAGALTEEPSVTQAAFAAGFSSLSRFYDAAANRLGLAPASMLAGAHGEVIVTAQTAVPLGVVTAAFSRNGVAAITLADTAADGLGEVFARFRHAMIVDGGADFDRFMETVLESLSEPEKAAELPLDIRGTAFEARVWEALRQIPIGTTASYGEIAAAIGAPSAHRAVARACGANAHAVAIPCHRVVRADGSVSGYRWGVSRKQALLDAEGGALV